jgi:hypothetical protein
MMCIGKEHLRQRTLPPSKTESPVSATSFSSLQVNPCQQLAWHENPCQESHHVETDYRFLVARKSSYLAMMYSHVDVVPLVKSPQAT